MKPVQVIVLFLLLFSQSNTANSAQLLRNDPFKKPELPTKEVSKNILNRIKQPVKEVWLPQLRATMRSGKQSMVNINGDVIKVGEKIDGFKLLRVYEREALFIKNGIEYSISMDQNYDESP